MYKAMDSEEPEFIGKALRKTKILHISEEYDKQWIKKKSVFQNAYVDIAPRPFGKSKSVEEWEERIKKILEICKRDNYEMVVFDTLDVFWAVKDENDAADAGDSILPLRLLTEANICVLAVFHARKTGGNVGFNTRGSGAFNDRMDGIISFERFNENDVTDNRRKIIIGNGRFYDDPFVNILEFDPKKSMYYKVAESSQEIKLDTQGEELLQFVSANPNEALSSNAIIEKMKEQDYPAFNRTKMSSTLEYLYKKKIIDRKRDKSYFVYWKIVNPFKEVK
jgi:hypothetical protein